MTNIATDRMDIYYQQVDKLIVRGTSRDVKKDKCAEEVVVE